MLLNLDASDWLLVAPALMPLLLIDFGAIVALLHHKPTISSSRDRLTRRGNSHRLRRLRIRRLEPL
jgi:hypothetical protein